MSGEASSSMRTSRDAVLSAVSVGELHLQRIPIEMLCNGGRRWVALFGWMNGQRYACRVTNLCAPLPCIGCQLKLGAGQWCMAQFTRLAPPPPPKLLFACKALSHFTFCRGVPMQFSLKGHLQSSTVLYACGLWVGGVAASQQCLDASSRGRARGAFPC